MQLDRFPAYVLSIVAFGFLVGCAARGAPELVQTGAGDDQALIPGCKNVAWNYRVESFTEGSYLTTWDSALLEGAQEGIRRPLDDSKGTAGAAVLSRLRDQQPGRVAAVNRLHQSPAASWGVRTNTLGKIPEPFCRRFSHKREVVALAARDVLSGLKGYRLLMNNVKWGVFETSYVERRVGKLRWRDRFVIYVDPGSSDSSEVRIFRDIYIDRSGSMFNQGVSVGRNEAYILTKMDDLLRRRP